MVFMYFSVMTVVFCMPLIQMAILVIGALLLQTVLVCCGALITPRIEPIDQSLIIVDLSQNPAFWLRITVGLFSH